MVPRILYILIGVATLSILLTALAPVAVARPSRKSSEAALGSSRKSSEAGVGSSGGGSECMAIYMRSAYEASQWLAVYGGGLNPPVSGDLFLLSIDPNDIHLLEAEEENFNLRDRSGKEVAVLFFDESKPVFNVRCDRLKAMEGATRVRLIAHEIFRKMHVEGDRYEVSRQIFDRPARFGSRPLRSSTLSGGLGSLHTYACDFRVFDQRNSDAKPLLNRGTGADSDGPTVLLSYRENQPNADLSMARGDREREKIGTTLVDRHGQRWHLNVLAYDTVTIEIQGPTMTGTMRVGASPISWIHTQFDTGVYTVELICVPKL